MKYFINTLVLLVGVSWWIYIIGGCGINTDEPPVIGRTSEVENLEWDYTLVSNRLHEKELEEEFMHNTSIESSIKEKPKKYFVRYVYKLHKLKEVNCYATCYSKEDGEVEAKGVYANQNFADKLHLSERRIKRHHWTVALNYCMRGYHEDLVEIKDKYGNRKWTHRYRFHVPGYNKDRITDYSETDSGYFSVPRDRMSHHTGIKKGYKSGLGGKCLYCMQNRIDVLFTTAGNYATIKQRSSSWANKNTHNIPVEIWEWKKFSVYSDGSREEVDF